MSLSKPFLPDGGMGDFEGNYSDEESELFESPGTDMRRNTQSSLQMAKKPEGSPGKMQRGKTNIEFFFQGTNDNGDLVAAQ